MAKERKQATHPRRGAQRECSRHVETPADRAGETLGGQDDARLSRTAPPNQGRDDAEHCSREGPKGMAIPDAAITKPAERGRRRARYERRRHWRRGSAVEILLVHQHWYRRPPAGQVRAPPTPSRTSSPAGATGVASLRRTRPAKTRTPRGSLTSDRQ